MTLQDYIKEQKDALEKFEAHWKEGITDNPLDFPSTMESGDWDEQYLAFQETL